MIEMTKINPDSTINQVCHKLFTLNLKDADVLRRELIHSTPMKNLDSVATPDIIEKTQALIDFVEKETEDERIARIKKIWNN